MFVIKWATHGYVTKGQPNRKPYTRDMNDPDVQVWKTKKAAEDFLDRKDGSWAADCTIEKKTKVSVVERTRNGDDGLGWGGEYWFVNIEYKGKQVTVETCSSKKQANEFAEVLRSLEP